MAKDRSKPLSEITFYCKPCLRTFKAEPDRVEEVPEQEHHPFAYYGNCPICGKEREQAWFEQNLLKAHAAATGPRTDEGKAASAANLVGHPTSEEAMRTRFNGMKHGMYARTATYFPSKPDGYPFCASCDVDRVWCKEQPACVKQTEIFLKHHAAFEQRNTKHLNGIYSDLQATVFSLLQMILQTIVADGVKIEAPQWYTDKETNELIIAEYIDENGDRRIIKDIEAHPLFKPLGELLSRTGLSLTDMGMTAKVIDGEESEFGKLGDDHGGKESMDAFRQRQSELLANLAGKVMRANKQTESDPILIEYNQESGS